MKMNINIIFLTIVLFAVSTISFIYCGKSNDKKEDKIEKRIVEIKPPAEEKTKSDKKNNKTSDEIKIENNISILDAVIDNDLEKVKLLIKSGVKVVNYKTDKGLYILEAAINSPKANIDIVETLIKAGANVNYKTEKGNSLLMLAVSSNKPNKDIIELLIKSGADINYRNNDNITVLSITKNKNRQKEIIDLLVKNGAKE